MTETETKIFVALLFDAKQQQRRDPVPAADLKDALAALDILKPEAFGHATFAVIVGSFLNHVRLSPPDTLYDPSTAMLALIMSATPGLAALWAWTIFQRGRELGRPYTLDDWTNDFPNGPPTSDAALAIWDAQKGEGESAFFPLPTDNILDVAATWTAPQEQEATNA